MSSYVAFPYRTDGRGRTHEAAREAWLHGLIEQLLFTLPGERVNRPDFGCGLMQLVFAPNSAELAVTVQALVQASLQQWLGQLLVRRTVFANPARHRLHGLPMFPVADCGFCRG